LHTVLDNTALLSTKKSLKLVDECRLRDMVYRMTEKTQFSGFMFVFPQVVQKH